MPLKAPNIVVKPNTAVTYGKIAESAPGALRRLDLTLAAQSDRK